MPSWSDDHITIFYAVIVWHCDTQNTKPTRVGCVCVCSARKKTWHQHRSNGHWNMTPRGKRTIKKGGTATTFFPLSGFFFFLPRALATPRSLSRSLSHSSSRFWQLIHNKNPPSRSTPVSLSLPCCVSVDSQVPVLFVENTKNIVQAETAHDPTSHTSASAQAPWHIVLECLGSKQWAQCELLPLASKSTKWRGVYTNHSSKSQRTLMPIRHPRHWSIGRQPTMSNETRLYRYTTLICWVGF